MIRLSMQVALTGIFILASTGLALAAPGGDADGDGLPDAHEQELAEKYAPIVFHENAEPNLPTNVDEFLRHTTLRYHDENCVPPLDETVAAVSSQSDLLSHTHNPTCGSNNQPVRSDGTLSDDKRTTFYLADTDSDFQKGSTDSKQWTVYFHCYPANGGGIVLQYWRFYAYNTGKTVADVAKEYLPGIWAAIPGFAKAFIGSPKAGYHGGDWECVQVVLDAKELPSQVWMLGHTSIDKFPWDTVPKDQGGTHIKVHSEYGGHSSVRFTGPDESAYIRQECWTGGRVQGSRPGFQLTTTGTLLNLGEKLTCLNGQTFTQYTGLWGSPSKASAIGQVPLVPHDVQDKINQLTAALYPYSSGYWGPAYNETEKQKADDFITAWAHDLKASPAQTPDGKREGYPQFRLPP